MKNQKFQVSGMTCSACSSHVEKSVGKLEGVKKVSVNLLTNSMQVEYEEEKLTQEQIMEAVQKGGYGACPLEERTSAGGGPGASGQGMRESGAESVVPGGGLRTQRAAAEAAKEERAMKLRLGISVGFWIPLMYVSMYHMFYEWFSIPIPGVVTRFLHGPENAVIFAFTQLLLLLPILYVNQKYFTGGFRSLVHRAPNMDTLIAIGSAAALLYGVFAIYRIGYGLGHGELSVVEHYMQDIYFESAGTILTLITVGKYLESRSKGKTSEAITRLMDLSPKTAAVERDGVEMEIPTEQVVKGDIFLVKPGALVPVDGVVVAGSSSVDESAITGESIPVEKKEGDPVVSATINKAGFLRCEASRVGADTTLSQIIRLVEEAGASKAPIAKLADKIAGVFVPVVIVIALAAMFIWLAVGAGFEFAMSVGIAVLVISCPCALGLATPVAIMVGTGVGARHGILIKSGEALQAARDIDTVVMDKTGTITEGSPRVQELFTFREGFSREELLKKAASLEKPSEHPLAEALLKAAQEKGISLEEVTEFQAEFGKGIRGVLEDGVLYYIGKAPYLEEKGIRLTQEQQELLRRLAGQGKTPLLFADEKQMLGMIAAADRVKETSAQAVQEFKRLGIHTVMLTGDNAVTAEAIRSQLKIPEVIAEVLPEEKAAKIAKLKAEGRKVAMIGDGINDAPALAGADVGIAIGAGTDVAMESADIVLMKNDLLDAVTVVRLSRAVIRNIKENLFWAFFYNCIGIPVAAGVFYPIFHLRLNPMFGAAAMSLSSIFVVTNALRLKGFSVKYGAAGHDKKKEEKIMTKTVKIEGMMCAHCTGRVQQALEGLAGVESVQMDLEKGTAAITANGELEEDAVRKAVEEAGYQVTGME